MRGCIKYVFELAQIAFPLVVVYGIAFIFAA